MESREAITAQFQAALESAPATDRGEGVSYCLGWVLGLHEVSPILGLPVSMPTGAQIAAEASEAESVLFRHRDVPSGRSWEWVAGVEHAAVWVSGRATSAPIDDGQVAILSARELRDELDNLNDFAQVDGEVLSPDARERLRGTTAAVGWVLGVELKAPLSGRSAESAPDVSSVELERDLAHSMRFASGPAPDGVPEVHPMYLLGVDRGLGWAVGTSVRSF